MKSFTTTIFAAVMMAIALSSVQAFKSSFTCLKGGNCIVSGIEQTRCGATSSSTTRKCNILGKNCNWCDAENTDTAEFQNVSDSVTAWCRDRGGDIVGSTWGNIPDC